MRKQLIIHHGLHSVMLPDSGRQLAASGTPGSVRDDLTLSDADRRFLGDAVTVVAVEDEPVTSPAVDEVSASETPETSPSPRPKPRARN